MYESRYIVSVCVDQEQIALVTLISQLCTPICCTARRTDLHLAQTKEAMADLPQARADVQAFSCGFSICMPHLYVQPTCHHEICMHHDMYMNASGIHTMLRLLHIQGQQMAGSVQLGKLAYLKVRPR